MEFQDLKNKSFYVFLNTAFVPINASGDKIHTEDVPTYHLWLPLKTR